MKETAILLIHFFKVHNLIEDIQISLAECLFCWSCQTSLNKENSLHLLSHLQQVATTADGVLSSVNIALIMTFLYSIDVRQLEHDDSQGLLE